MRRKAWFFVWIARFALALVLLTVLGLGAILWRLDRGPISLNFLIPHIEAMMAESPYRLDTEALSLVWFEDSGQIGLQMVGTAVFTPNGDVVATLPFMRVMLHTPSLMIGKVRPASLIFLYPGLNFVITREHELNFAIGRGGESLPFGQNLLGLMIAEDTGNSNTAMASHLEVLEIRHAQMDIAWQASQEHIFLSQGNLLLRQTEDGMVWSVRAQSERLFEQIALTGLYRQIEAAPYIVGEGTIESFDTGLFSRFDPLFRQAGHITGHVDIEGDFSWRPADFWPYLSLVIEGEEVNYAHPWLFSHLIRGRNLAAELLIDPEQREWLQANATFDIVQAPGRDSVFAVEAVLSEEEFWNREDGSPLPRAMRDMTFDLSLDVKDVPIESLGRLWPNSLYPETKDWVTAYIQTGIVDHAEVDLRFVSPPPGDVSHVESTQESTGLPSTTSPIEAEEGGDDLPRPQTGEQSAGSQQPPLPPRQNGSPQNLEPSGQSANSIDEQETSERKWELPVFLTVDSPPQALAEHFLAMELDRVDGYLTARDAAFQNFENMPIITGAHVRAEYDLETFRIRIENVETEGMTAQAAELVLKDFSDPAGPFLEIESDYRGGVGAAVEFTTRLPGMSDYELPVTPEQLAGIVTGSVITRVPLGESSQATSNLSDNRSMLTPPALPEGLDSIDADRIQEEDMGRESAIELRPLPPTLPVLPFVPERLEERENADLDTEQGRERNGEENTEQVVVENLVPEDFGQSREFGGHDSEVIFAVAGRVEQGGVQGLGSEITLDNINAQYRIENDGASITGQGRVNGNILDFSFRQNFPAGDGRLDLEGTIPIAALEVFDIATGDYLQGRFGLDAEIILQGGNRQSLIAQLNLRDTELRLPALDYYKPARQSGSLSFRADLQNFVPFSIRNLDINLPDLAARGGITLRNAEPVQITLTPMQWGESFFTLEARQEDENWRVILAGESLDIEPILSANRESEEQSEMALPFTLEFALEEMRLGADSILLTPNGEISYDGNDWQNIDITARTHNQGLIDISYRFEEEDNRYRLEMVSSDAGGVFQALGMTDTVIGGDLYITGWRSGSLQAPLTGDIQLDNFRAVELPFLGKLLSALSLPGLFSALQGEGIHFTRLTGEFNYGNDLLSVRRAQSAGGALGITFEGDVDLAARTINSQGTVVPIAGINRVIETIPFLGGLISGGEGQGIFSFTYSARGALDDPEVFVNPVSILLPGFLRSLFFQDLGLKSDLEDSTPDTQPETPDDNGSNLMVPIAPYRP